MPIDPLTRSFSELSESGPSVARLAAEALFEPQAVVKTESGVPTVVKRRRPENAAVLAPALSALDDPPLPRSPRVFRTARPTVALPGTNPTSLPMTGYAGVAPDDAAPIPKKRRRRLHGTVIITKMAGPATSEVQASSPQGSLGGEPEIKAGPARRALAKGSNPPTPAASGFEGYPWPLYPRLLAEIRALDVQIEEARARERPAVVRWVRGLISHYGLTASDLDLA